MFKLDLEKAEEPEIKLPTLLDHIKSKGIQNKISTSASLTTLKPLTVCMHTCSVALVIYLRPYGLCPPASSVHGILQARILVWVAMPFSRGSFWPRDRSHVSVLQVDSLPTESPRKPFHCVDHNKLWKILKEMGGTFLVVQWLDSMLPTQGAWVQSLVRELDPTFRN